MSATCDVVVVGGGHNGLVCAAYLARAGLSVVVVERNPRLGGALLATTTADGARLELGALEHKLIAASGVVEELELGRHGLRFVERPVAGAHLFGDGTVIAIADTAEETAASIAQIDPHDARAWLSLVQLSGPVLAASGATSGDPAPGFDLATATASTLLGARGRQVAALARMSVLELAQTWFRSPYMRAVAMSRAAFSNLPPWYPGTGATFLFSPGGHGTSHVRAVGGSPALVGALEAALVAAGGEVRCGFEVAALEQADTGWRVRSADGEQVRAAAVVSAIPPQTTLLRLVRPPSAVPTALRRRMERAVAVGGNVSQLSLAAALRSLPSLDALPDARYDGSVLHLAETPDAVIGAYDAAAFGTAPDRLGALVSFPSVMDPTAAPKGAATIWVNALSTHRFADGSGWEAHADAVADALWHTVESCLPGTSASVTDATFTSPAGWEAATGAENAGAHLATTVDQMLGGRPGVRTPVPGLYLSGAGTRLGGGVTGLPGRAAARAVLTDRRGTLGRVGARTAQVARQAARTVRAAATIASFPTPGGPQP